MIRNTDMASYEFNKVDATVLQHPIQVLQNVLRE